jgi:methyl coenzyme M reductase subunit D
MIVQALAKLGVLMDYLVEMDEQEFPLEYKQQMGKHFDEITDLIVKGRFYALHMMEDYSTLEDVRKMCRNVLPMEEENKIIDEVRKKKEEDKKEFEELLAWGNEYLGIKK